jgi:putative copper export protein
VVWGWPEGGALATTANHLAPAIDGVRLSLHVLAAAVWVGGQITVGGLVPTARTLGDDAPRALARAFSRMMWPAYGLLLITGIWNVAAVHTVQPTVWQAVLGIKIAVVLVAGLAAWLHGRAKGRRDLALWGAVTAVASVTALVLGVYLAG